MQHFTMSHMEKLKMPDKKMVEKSQTIRRKEELYFSGEQ